MVSLIIDWFHFAIILDSSWFHHVLVKNSSRVCQVFDLHLSWEILYTFAFLWLFAKLRECIQNTLLTALKLPLFQVADKSAFNFERLQCSLYLCIRLFTSEYLKKWALPLPTGFLGGVLLSITFFMYRTIHAMCCWKGILTVMSAPSKTKAKYLRVKFKYWNEWELIYIPLYVHVCICIYL